MCKLYLLLFNSKCFLNVAYSLYTYFIIVNFRKANEAEVARNLLGIVATSTGELICFVQYQVLSTGNGRANIDQLFTMPQHRGHRVIDLLLAALIDKEKGVNIFDAINVQSEHAKTALRRFGFVGSSGGNNYQYVCNRQALSLPSMSFRVSRQSGLENKQGGVIESSVRQFLPVGEPIIFPPDSKCTYSVYCNVLIKNRDVSDVLQFGDTVTVPEAKDGNEKMVLESGMLLDGVSIAFVYRFDAPTTKKIKVAAVELNSLEHVNNTAKVSAEKLSLYRDSVLEQLGRAAGDTTSTTTAVISKFMENNCKFPTRSDGLKLPMKKKRKVLMSTPLKGFLHLFKILSFYNFFF